MTTIKTICVRCGGIRLTPDDVALELRPGRPEGAYRFKCPTCAVPHRKPANPRVVRVLLATGVAFDVVNPEPITEVEITAFAVALEAETDPLRLLTG